MRRSVSLERVPAQDRLAVLERATFQATEQLAARFPDSAGFTHKVLQSPSWAQYRKSAFGVEIRFRRGLTEGFTVTISADRADARDATLCVGSDSWLQTLLIVVGMIGGVIGYLVVASYFPDFFERRIAAPYLGFLAGAIAGAILLGCPLVFVVRGLLLWRRKWTTKEQVHEIVALVEQAIEQAAG